jgi:hypothetical protein
VHAAAPVTLHPGHPAAMVECGIDAAAGTGTAYELDVEYQWGYAREAWYRGRFDTDELVLPFPGSGGAASFPFPRR